MFRRVLAKAHSLFYQSSRDAKRRLVETRVPQYEAVISSLTLGNATGVNSHPWRALDILKVLDASRPNAIVELGSGSSTAIFADYVERTSGASLLSVDEAEEWADLTTSALEGAGLLPHETVTLVAAERVETPAGSQYNIELPAVIDMLYIDGPSVMKSDSGKKLANQDIVRLLDRGTRPKTILVDGRHATVRAIREHASGSNYRFTPSADYIIAEAATNIIFLPQIGAFHRHCLFELVR